MSDRDYDLKNGRVQGQQVSSSLEQVREILFGGPFRELERKLARVDAHLATEAEELRKEMRRRLDVLEGHVQREAEALVARFESERIAHAESLAKANRESREIIGALEQRMTRLEESLARAQRELRQQILDQAKAFLDETRQARDEMAATVERELVALTEPHDSENERFSSTLVRAQLPDH
ncbi:hypothetical protein [Pendulispora albinea]|uniref:Uncharacterized protein n=1 Tax=Pendulispora albinea TaxID=2741071 RepID=A0ABZ2M0Z4_9BACT